MAASYFLRTWSQSALGSLAAFLTSEILWSRSLSRTPVVAVLVRSRGSVVPDGGGGGTGLLGFVLGVVPGGWGVSGGGLMIDVGGGTTRFVFASMPRTIWMSVTSPQRTSTTVATMTARRGGGV